MLTVVLLVAGYLLAVPPLFRLRAIVRNRWWPGYAAETAGAALITLGWALRGGTGAVLINGAWLVVFGLGFPLLTRWRPARAR